MNKYLLFTLSLFFSYPILAQQIVRDGGMFTTVSVVDGKVVFLKEIQTNRKFSEKASYQRMVDWAKETYGRDPFISSIRYDSKKNEFIAKSKVELLLPPNSDGKREKMIMRYRINGFLVDSKCVLEITDISYLYENTKYNNLDLPKVIRAEAFITDKEVATQNGLGEIKANTRKSTIYFVNELTSGFEKFFTK